MGLVIYLPVAHLLVDGILALAIANSRLVGHRKLSSNQVDLGKALIDEYVKNHTAIALAAQLVPLSLPI